MSPGATLRPAGPEDARGIAEAHIDGWRWGYRNILPAEVLDALSVEDREAIWLGALRQPVEGAHRFVAIEDGRVVGFVSCGPADDDFAPPPPDAAEVHALYVREAAVGRGLGRALLGQATDAMRHDGVDLAVLWVFEANDRARRLYGAAGWRPDGTLGEHRFHGGTRPVLRYARDLRSDRPRPG